LDNGTFSFLTWYRPGDSRLMLYAVVPVIVVALAIAPALALVRAPLPSLARIERALATRWAVLAIGIITAITFAYEWGTLRAAPLVHDEAAYVLQARIFAAGKWTDSAPVPDFFEQPHVLVEPRMAEKYGPGNAALLVPGIWLGLPGLMPVFSLALAGALIFALGRRIVNAWVGVLAWMVWLGLASPITTFRPSYFSEMLTQTLWLGGWWALLRWRDDRRVGYLLVIAACTGWMAITRPLTAVAFAIPLGAAVLWLTLRHRVWGQLAAAVAVGVCFLAVIPLWSAHSTGSWRTTPLMLYTSQYMPYDVPGFGIHDKPGTRAASPEIACFARVFGTGNRSHTLADVPSDLIGRARATLGAFFNDRRHGLIFFAALGVLASPLELGFMLATSVVLLLSYTTYAHSVGWTVYYLETQPVCALLVAAGVWVVVAAIGKRWRRRGTTDASNVSGARLASWCMLALVLLAIRPTRDAVEMVHHFKSIGDLPHKEFRQAVDSLPGSRNIVFVRYKAGEGCQQNLIQNDPPLASARSWIVSDRGADDARLLRAVPDRVPYLFDAEEKTMRPLPLDSLATR
jgi:hypothetical protein